MLPQRLELVYTAQLTPTVKLLTLEGTLAAQPGQFVLVWLPGLNEKPFSLVDDDPVTLAVARVGPFSSRLHVLEAGDYLWLRGPLGRGFDLVGDRMLLVGGGYGVAPLAFLAARATAVRRKVAVIGAGTKGDLFFEDRLAEAGCETVLVTEDCSAGQGGLCTDVAETLLAQEDFDVLYGCGPEGMLDRLERVCQERGIPGQVSKEAYMRCGMGVCGSCERDGLLVCTDGPVFTVGRALDKDA
jgi:dihydroorotate dehydrogenase electron transfer subunit